MIVNADNARRFFFFLPLYPCITPFCATSRLRVTNLAPSDAPPMEADEEIKMRSTPTPFMSSIVFEDLKGGGLQLMSRGTPELVLQVGRSGRLCYFVAMVGGAGPRTRFQRFDVYRSPALGTGLSTGAFPTRRCISFTRTRDGFVHGRVSNETMCIVHRSHLLLLHAYLALLRVL